VQQTFVLHTKNGTSFVLPAKKSRTKKGSKKAARKAARKAAKNLAKNTPKKHTLIYPTHMLIRKKLLKAYA
jgi:hypothetical protein